MSSYATTLSESTTFTITHARHITARIAADLSRLTSFYPTELSENRIKQFQEEATEYLRAGYLESVTFGFRKTVTDYFDNSHEEWVLALKYVVRDGELSGGSESPGGIRPGINIGNAGFKSYLIQNDNFFNLSLEQRNAFKRGLPIQRTGSDEPKGAWSQDRAYGQGSRHVNRYICGN